MKKCIICLIMVFILMTFNGCSWNKYSVSNEKENNDGMITTIYNDGFTLVIRDNRTGVEYIKNNDSGGMCVVVDKDGNPYIEE